MAVDDLALPPFSLKDSIHGAFPHRYGTLCIDGYVTVSVSFRWHQSPWDGLENILEITKTITDQEGQPHTTVSFSDSHDLWHQIQGTKAHRSDAQWRPLHPVSGTAHFYSDMRVYLLFNLIESLKPWQARKVVHFDKHSSGTVRLHAAATDNDQLVLEVQTNGFDDRVSGEWFELEGPLWFDIEPNLWITSFPSMTVEDHIDLVAPFGTESGVPYPIVFDHGGTPSQPEDSVRFIPGQWTPEDSKRRVFDFLRALPRPQRAMRGQDDK